MKKYQINFIGIILISLAIYFGLNSIDIKIEIQNSTPIRQEKIASTDSTPTIIINDNLIERLYQDKLKEYQDWGYANGLVMAKRALEESKWFVSMGWEDEASDCEEIIDKLYQMGYDNAVKRPN